MEELFDGHDPPVTPSRIILQRGVADGTWARAIAGICDEGNYLERHTNRQAHSKSFIENLTDLQGPGPPTTAGRRADTALLQSLAQANLSKTLLDRHVSGANTCRCSCLNGHQ